MSTKPGPVVETLPEEKDKVTTSYSVQIVTSETASWRNVTLEVKRRSTYRIQYTQRRKELGKRSSTPGWIGLGLGTSAVVFGDEISPPCTGDESAECTTESEKTKAQTAHRVVLGGMIVGLLGIWMITKADDSYEPTGGYILDEGPTQTETTSPAAPSNERISLTLDGTTRYYRTDARGQISGDMVDDFEVAPTERASMVVSVVLPNVEHSENALCYGSKHVCSSVQTFQRRLSSPEGLIDSVSDHVGQHLRHNPCHSSPHRPSPCFLHLELVAEGAENALNSRPFSPMPSPQGNLFLRFWRLAPPQSIPELSPFAPKEVRQSVPTVSIIRQHGYPPTRVGASPDRPRQPTGAQPLGAPQH